MSNMCLIIDTNILHPVFDHTNSEHRFFSCIKDWLKTNAKTRLIIGGTKYKTEIRSLTNGKYVAIYSQLRQAGRIIAEDDEVVDAKTIYLKSLEKDSSFDDAHVLALVVVSGCKILATNDQPFTRFAKMRKFYNKGQKPPLIFNQNTSSKVLKGSLLSPPCRGCKRLALSNP